MSKLDDCIVEYTRNKELDSVAKTYVLANIVVNDSEGYRLTCQQYVAGIIKNTGANFL